MNPPKIHRNTKIIQKYQLGYTQADLARSYGLTRQRVNKIIQDYGENVELTVIHTSTLDNKKEPCYTRMEE
jgi:hypothetical protein